MSAPFAGSRGAVVVVCGRGAVVVVRGRVTGGRVGVVVSTPVDDAAIAETIATIKAQHHGPVILGGVAIRNQAHAIALGGDIWTTSAREAVDHFDATT